MIVASSFRSSCFEGLIWWLWSSPSTTSCAVWSQVAFVITSYLWYMRLFLWLLAAHSICWKLYERCLFAGSFGYFFFPFWKPAVPDSVMLYEDNVNLCVKVCTRNGKYFVNCPTAVHSANWTTWYRWEHSCHVISHVINGHGSFSAKNVNGISVCAPTKSVA